MSEDRWSPEMLDFSLLDPPHCQECGLVFERGDHVFRCVACRDILCTNCYRPHECRAVVRKEN